MLGRSSTVLPGGKGANQAVAAARLGAHVTMVGAVGTDAHAGIVLTGLAAAGVDLREVRRVDGPTGLAVVEVSDDGENTIVVLSGANAQVTPDAVGSSVQSIAGAAVVVVQGELPACATEAAVRAATGRVIINLAPAIDLDPSVLLRADPLVVNEVEAGQVLAALGGDATSGPAAVVRALLTCGLGSVVLTLGGSGALAADADGVLSVAAPAVPVIDTTGAGDAFVGALAARLATGGTLGDAVRFAVRVGSFSVQHPGAQPSYPASCDDLPRLPD